MFNTAKDPNKDRRVFEAFDLYCYQSKSISELIKHSFHIVNLLVESKKID